MVYWTDIDGKKLHRCDLEGNNAQEAKLEQKAGCFVFRKSGGMLMAMEDGIYAGDPFSKDAGLEKVCGHPDPALCAAGGRFNDGRCDPAGRFYVGTLDPRKKGRAAMYVLEPGEKKLREIQAGFSTFNGIAFNPVKQQVWYSDTPRYELYSSSYDPKTGSVGRRELVRSWDQKKGARPDGAAFDADGNYWCAMYAGGQVLKLDNKGSILESHALPATYTTMAAFVGKALDDLVVTTGLRDDDPAEVEKNPQAGCLFCLEIDARGVVEPMFAG